MFNKSLLIATFALGLATSLFAEDFDLSNPAQWYSHYAKAQISKAENGEITIKNGAAFEIKQVFTIDPAKEYTVSFDACTDVPKGGFVSTAYILKGKNNRRIATENVTCAPASLTEIAADANAGDTSIKVKDASKFTKGLTNYFLALDAKADFSDLPNSNLIAVKCAKPVQENGVYILTLAKPLKNALKAGTPVRQHYSGSAFYFNDGFRKPVSADWKTFTSSKSGISKQASSIKFPRGSEKFNLHIFFAIPQGATAKIRNLKLNVADR